MKNKTLLILAAGMGSRFGGLKQVEPVGPTGETILEYSIYDALRVGFNKIVFIIKEENYDLFKEKIGSKIEEKVEVKYVFQNNENLKEFGICDREKPYGTAHAIYCAKEVINENFAIINADDFYGYDAFRILGNCLDENKKDNEFYLISYKVKNTLPSSGIVKRGICETNKELLTNIIESNMKCENNEYYACPFNENNFKQITGEEIVSMNMFGFTPLLFNYLDKDIESFFETNKNELDKIEYLIAPVVSDMIKKDIIEVKSIPTSSKWLGITYREDLIEVKKQIREKVENKEYPDKLF